MLAGMLQLRVNADGSTEYAFTGSPSSPKKKHGLRPQQKVFLKRDEKGENAEKGIGCYATQKLKPGALFSERSVGLCVVGENEKHICKWCLCKIKGKAVARADCRLTFCSHRYKGSV
jgi:hypothetical protein